jgi:hypothetical protein
MLSMAEKELLYAIGGDNPSQTFTMIWEHVPQIMCLGKKIGKAISPQKIVAGKHAHKNNKQDFTLAKHWQVKQTYESHACRY